MPPYRNRPAFSSLPHSLLPLLPPVRNADSMVVTFALEVLTEAALPHRNLEMTRREFVLIRVHG